MGEFIILGLSLLFSFWVIRKVFPPFGIDQMTVIELKEHLRDDEIQFIDVRTVEEFNKFHIYGFKNIPLNELKKEADTLAKDKRTIVISQRGTKGNAACRQLKRWGFTNLANVRGGVTTWNPH